MKRIAFLAVFVALVACSKKKDDGGAGAASGSAMAAPDNGSSAVVAAAPTPTPGAGSAPTPAVGSAAGSDTAAGSGSAVAAGSGAGSGSGSAEKPSTMGDSPFDKLTSEEKADFMKKNVVPAMKIEFQKFDPKAFANFGCKTCHGKDPKASKFKMPSPELPKLDFMALQAGKQKPKMAEFMGKVVKPQMAKILGEKEFDPANPKAGGFGCLECHEQKK